MFDVCRYHGQRVLAAQQSTLCAETEHGCFVPSMPEEEPNDEQSADCQTEDSHAPSKGVQRYERVVYGNLM